MNATNGIQKQRNVKSIRNWAVDDRPREKMMLKGELSLSDAELLAIIIGSGSRKLSAVEVSREILLASQNSLHNLSKLSIEELTRFDGIGNAKAITIQAAMELARRKMRFSSIDKIKVTKSVDAFNYLKGYFMDLHYEVFYVLLLNRANEIIEHYQLSKGGVTGTVVDGKLLFKRGLEKNATAMILAHNHPSGNVIPSSADKKLTKSLTEFGKLIDLQIIDHLVIADNNYYSFVDEGIMP